MYTLYYFISQRGLENEVKYRFIVSVMFLFKEIIWLCLVFLQHLGSSVFFVACWILAVACKLLIVALKKSEVTQLCPTLF